MVQYLYFRILKFPLICGGSWTLPNVLREAGDLLKAQPPVDLRGVTR